MGTIIIMTLYLHSRSNNTSIGSTTRRLIIWLRMMMRRQLRRLLIIRNLLKHGPPNTPRQSGKYHKKSTIANNSNRTRFKRIIGCRVLIIVSEDTNSSSQLQIIGQHLSRKSWSQMVGKRCLFITRGSTIKAWLHIDQPLCKLWARQTSHHLVYSNPTWPRWNRH